MYCNTTGRVSSGIAKVGYLRRATCLTFVIICTLHKPGNKQNSFMLLLPT